MSVPRLVVRPISVVVLGLAVAMFLCAIVGHTFQATLLEPRAVDVGSVAGMLVSAAVTAVVGVGGLVWSRGAPELPLGRREAILAVVGIWVAAGLLGGLPYVIGAGLGPIDALFEAISGFSTTGATVVADVEGTFSHPLLLWRSLTQWLGGMGIVVLFVAVFPNLGVGGRHMFRSEVPGVTNEGLVPRITEASIALWRIYLVLTALAGLAYWSLGMSLFDSLNHALTTLATGGFSTKNASIAHYDSLSIEAVTTVFMLVGGVNFALYYGLVRTGRLSLLLQSIELRVYLGLMGVMTLLLTLSLAPRHGSLVQGFRHAFFTAGSFLTSTGFTTSDPMSFPEHAVVLVLILMFIGGCAGSTSGGMKVERLVLLFEAAWVQVRRSIRPAVVQVVRLDRKVLDESALLEVATFFFLYLFCILAGTLLIPMWEPVSVPTAFGATLSSISNMGPALWYESADNFAGYSGPTKLVCAVAMVLGRLELFTVLALAVPDLWRR